ncbi:MAG: glycosyltransferase family 2 protein [Bacteroidia bacterium]|nr:glycosyltransferase family 2 protein [Bacteroidia bacterium]
MIVIELILLLYFLYVVFYTLIFSIAGVVRPYGIFTTPKSASPSVAVIIPAYKEDTVIVSSAAKALHQGFPQKNYDVIIIADSLRQETLLQLRQLPVIVVEVSFDSSTKVKALRAGIAALERPYDIVVVLDADNVMENDFLEKVSVTWRRGILAIQGRRVAANNNTHLAVLDGLSEILNNHIYRKGSSALGLSASLSGSAMAFDFPLFEETLRDMDSTGGFDRDMEVRLGMRGIKVFYLAEAIVYDEKVSRQEVFANQRKRWIASQYQYLGKYFATGIKALFRRDFSLFNSSVLRNIQLPRVINIGLLGLIAVVSIPLQPWLNLSFYYWWILLLLLGFAMILAVPVSFYDRKFFQALGALPGTFFTMFTLLFRLKGANKQFIHTPHGEDQKENISSQG